MPTTNQEAVAAVVFNEARTEVLLVKRCDIPVWVLPGGGIEPGEQPEEAAMREMAEETGYKVNILRKVANYQTVNRFTQPTHFFECGIVSGSAQTSAETSDVRFFPLSALPKHLPDFYKGWIADAESPNSPTITKKIEGVSYWAFIKYLITHPALVIRYLLLRSNIQINK